MRTTLNSLAMLLTWSTAANFAAAQFGNLGQSPTRPRPTVSPYINQGVGGGINAYTYYGIIKPQYDASRSIQDLQAGITRLNPDGSLKGPITDDTPGALGGLQTGHTATFFNYGHYFPLVPPGGGTGAGGTAGYGPGMGGRAPGGYGAGYGGSGMQRGFYAPYLNTFPR